MPRRAQGLTAAQVDKGTKPGSYGDGAGLYLLVRSLGQLDLSSAGQQQTAADRASLCAGTRPQISGKDCAHRRREW